MQTRAVDILLVEPDAELAAMIKACLAQAMPASLTIVADSTSALREELTARHQVVVMSTDLPDAHWCELAGEIRRTNRAPLILLAENPTTKDLLHALRVGGADVLVKPFDLVDLVEMVRRAATKATARRRHQVRNRRLRKLTARIVRERRDLRQRIDLICRDFVHAYRRLAQRVSEADLLSHK